MSLKCRACGLLMVVNRPEFLHEHLKLSKDCLIDYKEESWTMFLWSAVLGHVVRVCKGTICHVKKSGYMKHEVWGMAVGGKSVPLRRFLNQQAAENYLRECGE